MAADHRAPGVRDQRQTGDAVMGRDETDGLLKLPAGLGGAAKRLVRIKIGVAVGKMTKTMKVQAPDIEPGIAQRIAP